MSQRDIPRLNRRKLLTALGVGVSGGLAGCGGDGQDGESPTAPPEDGSEPAGETASPPPEELTFRVGLNSEPSTLDIHESDRLPEGMTLAPIHETLFYLNEDIEPQAHLVADYEIMDEATQFVFQLEEGVTFHNGTEFTADQVIWNFERLDELGLHSPVFEPIANMESEGRYELTLESDRSYPLFLRQLSDFPIAMAPQDAVEEAGDDWGREVIVGTGPFKFVNWAPADFIELEAYEDYDWGPDFVSRPQSNVDRIVWDIIPESATRANEVTVGDLHADYEVGLAQAASIENHQNTSVRRTQSTWTFLPMNTEKSPTDEIEVRRAIAHTVDREPLIQVGLNGEGVPAWGPVPPFWGNALSKEENQELAPALDLDAARAELDAAGWTNSEQGEVRTRDGEELVLNHLSFPFPLLSNQGEAIQAMLSEVGIRTELEVPEASTFYSRLENNEHHIIQSGGAFTPFASAVLAEFYHSSQEIAETGGNNYSNYGRDDLDQLIEESQFNPDPAARSEAAKEAQRIIHEDVVIVQLNLLNRVYGFKNEVQGIDRWTEHPLWWSQYHVHVREVGL